MAEPIDFKYRAFLSYAHADTRWAKRLHRRLEGFSIDKDLVGRATAQGPIPKTMRPVFRDREDFTAGHTLTDQTLAALDASAALIVLCSPASAKSHYVSEEIRLFKSRHPDRPVIPVIIEGKPGDPEQECFAPALRFRVAAEGTITDTPDSSLAADLRESGDGENLGVAKVVARLLDLSTDEVFRRAERDRRRHARVRNGTVAVVAVLVIGGGFLAWRSYQTELVLVEKQATLSQIEALVAKYSPMGAAQAAVPGAKAGLTEAITAIANGSASDLRYAKALELLKAGKPAEAEPLLKAVADEKAARVKADVKQAAEAYRHLAAIAGVADPRRARQYYARVLELDPDDVEALNQAGWLEKQAGNLDRAEQVYRRLFALSAASQDSSDAFGARRGLGNVRNARGDLAAAKFEYLEALAIAERLARARPDDADWQERLSTIQSEIGDVLIAQGDLPGALKLFLTELTTRENLARASPGNLRLQQSLSVSNERVGSIYYQQGKLEAALAQIRASLERMVPLRDRDPADQSLQYSTSVTLALVGDVLAAQGNRGEALKSYRESLAIRERLTKSDPDNGAWQSAVSGSHERIGAVFAAQGNLPEALASFRTCLAIREHLAKSYPNNSDWNLNLAIAHGKIGDVLRAQDRLPEALKSYQADLEIMERLTKTDPSNAHWQYSLAITYERNGTVLDAQGDRPGALRLLRDALAIRERLVTADPSNAVWQRSLGLNYNQIGVVLEAQHNLPEALTSYQAARSILSRLVLTGPDNTVWQHDHFTSLDNIGDVLVAQGNLPEALTSYRAALDIMVRLTNAEPDSAGWQLSLSITQLSIGDALTAQGNLPQALEFYQASLGLRERLAKADPSNMQRRKSLETAISRLGSLTYKFIFAGDFARAAAIAERATSLAPDLIWLHTNRAHALMFLGRVEEARSVYLQYRGQMAMKDKRWEVVIREDFAELRAAKLTHGLMDEIERVIGN